MDLQHTQQYGYSLKDTEAEEVIRGEASVDEIAVGPRGSIDERQWDLTTPRQDGGHFPTSPKAATVSSEEGKLSRQLLLSVLSSRLPVNAV